MKSWLRSRSPVPVSSGVREGDRAHLGLIGIACTAALVAGLFGMLIGFLPLPAIAALGILAGGIPLMLSIEPVILGVLLVRRVLDINQWFGTTPFFLSNVASINVGISALLVVSCLYWILRQRVNIGRMPLLLQWLSLLGLGGIGVIVAPNQWNSVQQWLRLVSFAAVFLLTVMMVKTRAQVYRLIAVFLIATIIPNVAAMYEVYASGGQGFRYLDVPRIYEDLGSGPAHAIFLIIPVLLASMLFIGARSLKLRLVYGCIIVSLGVPFFYTLARGAWAGVALALLIMTMFAGNTKQKTGLLFLIVVAAGAVVTIPAIRERYLALGDPRVDPSLVNRMAIWSASLDLFRTSPVIGVGLGTANDFAGMAALGHYVEVHNDILRVLTDLGILGLVAYAWLYVSLLRGMSDVYRHAGTGLFRGLALAGIGVWIAMQFAGLTNNVFTNSTLQYSYWAFAGLVMRLSLVENAEALSGSRKASGKRPVRAA